MTEQVEIRHAHLFCGIGAGARGFNLARPSVGTMQGVFRCLGGVDVDPLAIEDFGRMAGVAGTVLDLFDRSQYLAFHGREPGADWREAGPSDIHRAFGNERPHIVFLSAPCKGFSGLLSEGKSNTDKYQALNRLTLRGVWLMLEAYRDDPVDLVLFENVPLIASRGRKLLDQIGELLRAYGYAVAETTHDCGEIGGLAQSRKRFLLVARNQEKVPPHLYEPVKRPLRAVGDVLRHLPLPGDSAGGALHRVPGLQWKTWVRLAFVEAGGDWRSLNRLAVEDGVLRDYLITPTVVHAGILGVNAWNSPMGTITSKGLPNNGNFSVADPRCPSEMLHNCFKVVQFNQPSVAVSAGGHPSAGGQCVNDPRTPFESSAHQSLYRVVEWDRSGKAVTGANHVAGGALSLADPRPQGSLFGKYAVTDFDQAAGTVIAGSTTGQGAFAVADPRPGMHRGKSDAWVGGGHYGVLGWDQASHAVSASAKQDNGFWSLADPRPLPAAHDKLVCRILSLDGTWHRPFTTLELAALQSLFDPEEWFHADGGYFSLAGKNDERWREGIGNAVPCAAATAIAECMGQTLLLAWSGGESFRLSAVPVWVQPVAVALSVRQVSFGGVA